MVDARRGQRRRRTQATAGKGQNSRNDEQALVLWRGHRRSNVETKKWQRFRATVGMLQAREDFILSPYPGIVQASGITSERLA